MPRAAKIVQLPATAGPAPSASMLEPPDKIKSNEHAFYAWQVMAAHLAQRGVASASYSLAMEMACGAYAQAKAAEEKMLENPSDCHVPVHYHRASKLFLDYCRQFGLTLSSRQQTDSRQLRLRWDQQANEAFCD